MCIAAVIFKPISLAYLKEMDNDNPHGGGIACVKEGRIWFLKGLDAEAVFALQQAQVLTYPYLLHYRWATMGAKIAENCHPFVVGPRAMLGETCGFAERVLIHNGSWSNYQKYIPLSSEIPDAALKYVSDTALAAWLLQDNPDLLDEVPWATAVAEMKDGEMDITTRGTWTDHQGNWYSNLNWLPSQNMNWDKWWETSRYNRPSASDYKPDAQRQSIAPSVCPLPGATGAPGETPNKTESTVLAKYNKDGHVTWPGRPDYDRENGGVGEVTVEQLLGRDAARAARLEELDPNEVPWAESPAYDSWEDYVRAKYGDEAAKLIDEEEDSKPSFKATNRARKTIDEELADLDIVSESHDAVNQFLAKQMLRDA